MVFFCPKCGKTLGAHTFLCFNEECDWRPSLAEQFEIARFQDETCDHLEVVEVAHRHMCRMCRKVLD